MNGLELDDRYQPVHARSRGLRRTIMPNNTFARPDDGDHRLSRIHMPQMPSLLRRFTSRRRPTDDAQPRQFHTPLQAQAVEADAQPTTAPPSRRRLSFANLARSANPRFSYIHQETVTTISERGEQAPEADSGADSNVAYSSLNQDDDMEDVPEMSRSRRRRLSLQMSNFFTNITSPGNRRGMHFPSTFSNLRPFSPTRPAAPSSASSSAARLRQPRSRLSVQEPIAELDDFEFRPPTPAEVRMNISQENVEDNNESEYERGFTPRRRRLRPQPVVGEPHDEDYLRRRTESDRRARRATWGPTSRFSFREPPSMDSLHAQSRAPIEVPTPSTSSSSYLPLPPQSPSLFSRAFSNSSQSDPPETHTPLPRETRPSTSSNSLSMFRPGHILRQLAANRRNSSRSENPPPSTIPLAELQRLLASYAAQSSDRDYNGHQETTVDGGTITIYGIRRVNARTNSDSDDGGLLPPPSPSESTSEERPPQSRDRPRGPRRIFNFIGPGLSEIDPLPPEFEETFERLRRTRRPRSMFGSGSLRRNGVVEPDVPSTNATTSATDSHVQPPTSSTADTADEPANASPAGASGDTDETWIFYIVSAVLPEGHPLLSAPSLFTDNPTYEDMLFLDSFLQKPVASRSDLASARGVYRICRRRGMRYLEHDSPSSVGGLYATAADDGNGGGDVLDIGEEQRCLICLSEFEEGETARRLRGCGHFFHRDCIDTWLTEGRNSCPLCRGEGVEKKQRERRQASTAAGPSSLNVI